MPVFTQKIYSLLFNDVSLAARLCCCGVANPVGTEVDRKVPRWKSTVHNKAISSYFCLYELDCDADLVRTIKQRKLEVVKALNKSHEVPEVPEVPEAPPKRDMHCVIA